MKTLTVIARGIAGDEIARNTFRLLDRPTSYAWNVFPLLPDPQRAIQRIDIEIREEQ